jgi:hypothetical protein
MLIPSSVTLIKALTIIRRERLLPTRGEVTVRVGQEVSPVQVVARASQVTGYQILSASTVLDVPAQEVEKYLLVQEGAALQRGMPLMRGKRSLLGKSKRYASPIDGVLLRVQNGTLILQQNPDLLELRALMTARVASVLPGRGVVLEASGSIIQALWDSGKEGFGKVRVAVERPDATLQPDQVDAETRGSVLVVGRLDRAEMLQQAEDNGVRGIIAGSFPAALVQNIAQLSLPVFVTDGVGQMPMASAIFELLQQSEGREAALFARTSGPRSRQPEIIIPVPAAYTQDQPTLTGLLEVGRRVRVLRTGNESLIGRVVAVYPQARRTKIGMRLPGADVEMADGEVVFVPYSNLDMIA